MSLNPNLRSKLLYKIEDGRSKMTTILDVWKVVFTFVLESIGWLESQKASKRFSMSSDQIWGQNYKIENGGSKMMPPPYHIFAMVPTCDLCSDAVVMRCAWCTKYLCMKQFFTDYHFCSQYGEWKIANKRKYFENDTKINKKEKNIQNNKHEKKNK